MIMLPAVDGLKDLGIIIYLRLTFIVHVYTAIAEMPSSIELGNIRVIVSE